MSASDFIRGLGKAIVLGLYFGVNFTLAKVSDFVNAIFQLDKDWITRATMGMIVLSLIWGILGIIDALMVRIQEAAWGIAQALPLTAQEYEASITLHGMRDLFGFAQQLILAVFIYFTFKMLNIQPRLKWMFNLGFVLFNISFMLFEGPIIITTQSGFDNYFSATGWYYLAPIGVNGYSLYVVSPLWYIGWILLEIGIYLMTGWYVYHFYLASKNLKEKLPIFLVFGLVVGILILESYSGSFITAAWDLLAYYHVVGYNIIADQISFVTLWHGIVYIAWFPAVGAMYLLIPMLANKPLYSDRMGRISALLYLVFATGPLGIHHLYMVDLPVAVKIVTEVLTDGIIVPSMMTFFNLWATAKGANIQWNILAGLTAMSFAGSVYAGVMGISNSVITYDAIVHEGYYVVAHFHAFILFSIVPAGFAALYLMVPMMTKRMWYSAKMSWIHFWGYMIGVIMVVMGFSYLGVTGLIRKEMIYPISSTFVTGQLIATAGAIIADLATVVWLINVVLTLVKGKVMETEGLSLGELTTTIAMALNGNSDIVSNSFIKGINFVKAEIQDLIKVKKL
ncbi:cbb3-type cytochrome c oxidase subunit I [Sulfurisphaera javensis]|uniref:Cbb3-type cytochrome c oxidase subunit I n=1 Tax=Sulfurisphaera javensis TaxID=2049879 RepID=A0AAT9GS35_9CREN